MGIFSIHLKVSPYTEREPIFIWRSYLSAHDFITTTMNHFLSSSFLQHPIIFGHFLPTSSLSTVVALCSVLIFYRVLVLENNNLALDYPNKAQGVHNITLRNKSRVLHRILHSIKPHQLVPKDSLSVQPSKPSFPPSLSSLPLSLAHSPHRSLYLLANETRVNWLLFFPLPTTRCSLTMIERPR